MQLTAWSTLLALAVYIWMGANVGRARMAFKIDAPTMVGPEAFQSVLRVQANTVEQLVLFLPALWMCAFYFSDRWAALGGLAWSIGRIVYALGYYKSPSRRSAGFGITIVSTVVLMVCTAVGLLTF